VGLEAIEAAGGITFAQDGSAKYDSMPRNAVGAGCVDFVLTPEAIARELARIARHPFVTPAAARRRSSDPASKVAGRQRATGPTTDDGYAKILLLLRAHTGVDFSLYKASTIHRRITRRVVLSKLPTLDHYADFLRGNSGELDALYSDALIGVTQLLSQRRRRLSCCSAKFFPGSSSPRIPRRCESGSSAAPPARKPTPWRWPLPECADKVAQPRKLQVFATDLNEANLEKARHGLYPKTLAHDLSPARPETVLRRRGWRISGRQTAARAGRFCAAESHQRSAVLPHGPHQLPQPDDHLEPSLQKKLLPTFHYALKPGGYLFLGASESIGGFAHLFGILDKRHKVFVKKAAPTPAFSLPIPSTAGARTRRSVRPSGQDHAQPANRRRRLRRSASNSAPSAKPTASRSINTPRRAC